MEKWKQSLTDSVTSMDELATALTINGDYLAPVIERYPMRITRHYIGLIEKFDDPIWRQCVPDLSELRHEACLSADPLHEDRLSPVPGLIHRYPDRVVLLISGACAVYCRFCFRKRQVGCGLEAISSSTLKQAMAYIADNREIRDVILSGGDPLLLEDGALDEILRDLRAIPHVEIIRIGTRVPVTLPERITPELCAVLKAHHPVFINTHFNHPREINKESAAACALLADAGIPLGNQTVLLRGVNDDPQIMKLLMQKLLSLRVRPYYIHQMDLVQGTGHFRTPISKGLDIMRALRGHTSGMASPYYVIDVPGGRGKVPLLPETAVWRGGKWLLRSYKGEEIEYPDIV